MMKVFVVTYTHKHGLDVSVHRDQAVAYDFAVRLAAARVQQSWSSPDRLRFSNLPYAERLDLFNELELHEYGGGGSSEEIIIHERVMH